MDQLARHLEDHNLYDLDQAMLKDIFPNSVIKRMIDSENDIATACFNIVIRFARAYPLNLLNNLYGKVFKFATEEGIGIIAQISSILRKIYSDCKGFDKERRDILKTIFMDEYRHFTERATTEKSVNIFYIETCAYFVDNFFDIMNEDELSIIFDIIKIWGSNTDGGILNSVMFLTKIFTSKLQKDGEILKQIIDYLFEMEELNNAMKILSAIIAYKPRNYGVFFEKLINCYFEQLSVIDSEYQKYEENQEEYIAIIVDYIQTLSSLVNAFPGKILKLEKQYPESQYLENLFYYAFAYINYSSLEEPLNFHNDETEMIVLQNDDDDDDDIDDNDDDPLENIHDESWKVRKAAVSFTINLIKNFPNDYMNYLQNNKDYVDCFLILIHDIENNVQLEAFELINNLVKTYGNCELIKKQYSKWIERITTQLYIQKKSILPMALDIYAKLVFLKTDLSSSLYIKTFNLLDKLTDEIEIQTGIINLAFTLFRTQEKNENLIKIIIKVFTKLIQSKSSNSVVLVLQAVQHLYKYMNGTYIDELYQLTKIVIDLTTRNGEIMNQALLTTSIYLVLYPDQPLANDAFKAIIDLLNNGTNARVTPNVLALIAASPSYKKLQNCKKIISNTIFKYFSNVDTSIVYKSLCTLNLLLQKKIIDLSQDMIPELLKIASGNDKKCQILSFQNIFIQPTLIINHLDKLVELIRTKPYSKTVMEYVCKIILANIATSKDKIMNLVKSLINGKSLGMVSKTIYTNISHIIFVIYQQEKSIRQNIIQMLNSELKNQNELSLLNISLIGEIGFVDDIESIDKTLIDVILKAISDKNREISIAAAEAMGVMSIKSNYIYKEILKLAETESNISWLFSSKALLKKLSENNDAVKEFSSNITEITDILLKKANYNKETSQTISKALTNLLKIDNKNISKLIKNAKTNKLSAPISINAIAFYLQNVNDSKLLISTAKKVISLLDPKSPLLSEGCIYCLKIAVSQNQANVSELMDYLPDACEYSKMKGDHIVTQYFGNQQVTQDIGSKLRSYAIDTVIAYYNANPQVEIKKLLNVIYSAINDPNIEICGRALYFLSHLALNKDNKLEFINNANDIASNLQRLEINNKDKEAKNAFTNYLKAIFYTYKLIGKNEFPEIDKLYLSISDIPELEVIEQDFKVNATILKSQSIKMTGKHSVGFELMTKYHQSTAEIFLN